MELHAGAHVEAFALRVRAGRILRLELVRAPATEDVGVQGGARDDVEECVRGDVCELRILLRDSHRWEDVGACAVTLLRLAAARPVASFDSEALPEPEPHATSIEKVVLHVGLLGPRGVPQVGRQVEVQPADLGESCGGHREQAGQDPEPRPHCKSTHANLLVRARRRVGTVMSEVWRGMRASVPVRFGNIARAGRHDAATSGD